ncbi:MAG: type secretion protein [Paraburkholderia sp.]|nr:type secretion protein [Paraburkholderia sp.]
MLELRILSGLHRGTALPLDGETIRLGSGTANDIVLTDPGMPEHAVVLSRCTGADAQVGAGEGWTLYQVECDAPAATVASGMRVRVGPIVVAFAEEHEPWRSDAAPFGSRDRRAARRSATASLAGIAALLAALGAAAVLVLASGATNADRPVAPTRAPSASEAPNASEASGAAREPAVRRIEAVVHPARAEPMRPPFGLTSVRGGTHGFVITDDGHVLVPGNVWREFTLERIEPRRIVFSGRHAAELPW